MSQLDYSTEFLWHDKDILTSKLKHNKTLSVEQV